MTICVVALCDQGKTALAVADRMITGPDVEFEQDLSKIERLSGNCVALTAGSALAHTELFKATIDEIRGRALPSISEIVDVLKRNFVALRTREAEEQHFKPIGLTVETFLRNQRALDPDLVMRLTRLLETSALPLHILAIGVDPSGGHIYSIYDPGRSECYNALGFCAIGSGERHAESTFIHAGYSISVPLHQALYIAYEAKKAAEVAPGVGKLTDVAIIDQGGTHELDAEQLSQLETLYREKIKLEQAARSEVDAKLSAWAQRPGGGGLGQATADT